MKWTFRLLESTDMITKKKSYCVCAEAVGEFKGELKHKFVASAEGDDWVTKELAEDYLTQLKEELG